MLVPLALGLPYIQNTNYTNNSKPFGNPLGNIPYMITATFHDPQYFTAFHKEHTGIDLVAKYPSTSPITLYSTLNGILYTSDNACSGEAVLVKNSEYIIYYGHIKTVLKKPGSKINRGDKIAIMGESGELGKCVTGVHVHYQIYKRVLNDWMIIDPSHYLTPTFP